MKGDSDDKKEKKEDDELSCAGAGPWAMKAITVSVMATKA